MWIPRARNTKFMAIKRATPILFFMAFSLPHLSAQTPTISAVTVGNGSTFQSGCTSLGAGCTTDTNSVDFAYTVSPVSQYCWVQYGLSSGVYLWSSATILAGNVSSPTNLCGVPITGLKDGTTYYFLPTARPDPDDETNICNVSGCGAVEQVVTTPASSVSHLPALPNPVQANLMCEPDSPSCSSYSTAYTVVPLSPNGSNECASTANVSAPAGYSGTISIGDTLTTIFANPGTKLWYGTAFQIAQGATCIPPLNAGYNHGYQLPAMSIDPNATGGLITAANHRWIIFRTAPGTATQFPPFGTRTGSQFWSNYGGFKTVNPNTAGAGFYSDGSIFTGAVSSGQIHHWWIENLIFSVDETQTTANWGQYFAWDSNNGNGNLSEYIVMRGNHFKGESTRRSNLSANGGLPWIAGVLIAFYGTNKQFALVGNYADDFYWSPSYSSYPLPFYFTDGSVSGGGPVLIDNNYSMGMGEPIYLEVNVHTRLNPYDFTVSHNSLQMPLFTFAYATASGFGATGRALIEFKGCTRCLISGSYLNGTFSSTNSGAPLIGMNTVNYTVTGNYMTNIASVFDVVGTFTYESWNTSSSGNKMLYAHNLAWNIGGQFQTSGGGFERPVMQVDSSADNITFINNTIGPIGTTSPTLGPGTFIPWVIYSGGCGPMAGLRYQNNVVPVGFGNYGTLGSGGIGVSNGDGGAPYCGYSSHPVSPAAMGVISSPLNYAGLLGTAAGYADGAAGQSMTTTSTISGGSGYSNGNLSFTNCGTPPTATYTVTGSAVQYSAFSAFGVCTATSMTASAGAGGATLRAHYGLTPNYTWGNNVMVATTFNGTDMTTAQTAPACPGGSSSSYTYSMPIGDIYPCANSTTARLALAGYPGLASGNGTCTVTSVQGCGAGANVNQIESAMGTVTNIQTFISPTAAKITYIAPDTNACYVSSSSNTWVSDGGGNRNRSVVLSGLTPSTTYTPLLMCYRDQTEEAADMGLNLTSTYFPSDPWIASNPTALNTELSFTTLATGTRTWTAPCPIAAVSGATSCVVVMTPITGGTSTCMSTGTSCSISSLSVGDVSVINTYKNGSIVLVASDSQIFKVR